MFQNPPYDSVVKVLKRVILWATPTRSIRKGQETISSSTVLAFYDPKRPAVARANASGYGIGGVLMQDRRGELRPVAFCSRTLTEAEGRYVMSEK